MENKPIPTAEEFWKQNVKKLQENSSDKKAPSELLKEFAKLHVEAALQAAADKALMERYYFDGENNGERVTVQHANHFYKPNDHVAISPYSIRSAYPTDKIK